jgi:hypothetical protein
LEEVAPYLGPIESESSLYSSSRASGRAFTMMHQAKAVYFVVYDEVGTPMDYVFVGASSD